jgi:hypothetical protein
MRVTHRFEPARRPSTIGLFKPNTRGSEKPTINRWEHLTPLRYKLRAVYIPSTGFLLIEGMQCSADLHTGTDAAADLAASEGVIGNPYAQQASSGCPDAKVGLSQPGWAVYHNVSSLGFARCEAEARGSSTVFSRILTV